MLKKLVYASRRTDTPEEEVKRMLEIARKRNKQDGITGALVYDGRRFMQLLEGDHDAVARCFLRISMSPLHRNMEVGVFAQSASRLFGSWDLRCIDADARTPRVASTWRSVLETPFEDRLELLEAAFLAWGTS